jgi:hypothetical protein
MTKAERHKKYMREVWYPNNRAKHIAMVAKSKAERYAAQMKEIRLLKVACSKCGENNPACLDFHHRDPNKKADSVSSMLSRGLRLKTILKEVAKCEVLCANCHRKEHFGAVE